MAAELIFPAFLAGLLTFLAPCTLPLLPGYVAFISGVTPEELKNPKILHQNHWRIFRNGLLYVLGFSVVFILFGSLFGLGGAALFQYRHILNQIGGVLVILFGFYLVGGHKWKGFSFLNSEKRLHLSTIVKPGSPWSSFLFGAVFALGWSPCIGPVLGTILLLASTTATLAQGAFLLAVFSLGLGIPFLILAAGIGSATRYVHRISKYLGTISKIGGVFIIILGLLLLFDQLSVWNGLLYRLFSFLEYESLLNYL